MLTPDDLRPLVAANGRNPSLGPHQRREALAAAISSLPGASDDAVVDAAIAGLDSVDRNVRVAMLRVLALYGSARATEGVLRGLGDPARRAREVAIRAAQPHHLGSAEVVLALRHIAEDEGETDRLRRTAFAVLSSASNRPALPDVAREAIAALARSARFREPLLRRLCTSWRQTAETRALLQDIVRTGTKDEAVMATRALCDQVLLRTDIVPEAERRRIREQFDRGLDDLHRWVPSSTVAELFGIPYDPAP